MKRLLQRLMYCRCGNQRILAHDFVPPATRCDGRMRCASEVWAKQCSSGTATVAASALRREDGSDQSLFIISNRTSKKLFRSVTKRLAR